MPYARCRYLLLIALFTTTAPTRAAASELLFVPTPLQAAAPALTVPSTAPAFAAAAPAPAAALDATGLQELELQLGTYAPQLAQQYLLSAQAQQAAGRHEAALDTLAKAAHATRLQQGLDTPAQYDIITLQVRSHLARRDYLAAFGQQQHLLQLQLRQPDASGIDTAATRADLGDMYFDAFRKLVLKQESPARLLPPYGPQSLFLAAETLTPHQLAWLWLGHAQREYEAAISTMHEHAAWQHPLLVKLEEQLIQTLLLQAFERRIAIDPANFLQVQDPHLRDTLRMDERDHQYPFYRAGIEAHERIISYRQSAAATDPDGVSEAMLALGDWHLLFGHTRAARQVYARARQQHADAVGAAGTAQDMAASLPHQLPAFAGLYRTETAPEFSGYVDVAFSIGRSGRAQDVEVLGGTQNADARVQRQLRQQLRRAPFRPALDAEGRLAGGQRVSVRYHFAQI